MLLKFCFQFQANCNSVTNTCLAAWEIPDWPVLKLLLGEGNLKAKWWYANKVIRSDEKRERDDYQSIFAVEKRKCPFIFLGKNAVINDEIKEMIKKRENLDDSILIFYLLFWLFSAQISNWPISARVFVFVLILNWEFDGNFFLFSAFPQREFWAFAIRKKACFAHWRMILMGALQKLRLVQNPIYATLPGASWCPLL